MKTRVCFSLLGLVFLLMSLTSEAQLVAIPDANFRAFLETNYPTCMSGGMLNTTCTQVLTATSLNVNSKSIANLSGVEYFTALTTLYCGNNQLTVLPALPSSLTTLHCFSNQLTVLPSLPSSLNNMRCDFNQLTVLPSLPSSLEYLDCSFNLLSILPTLSSSLTQLICSRNRLTILPSLPSSLTLLYCYGNKLTVLPSLPSSLDMLHCYENQLTVLPALPGSLTNLQCQYNQLTVLPSLPSSLITVYCHNNQLTCLPLLPNALTVIMIAGNSITCFPNIPTYPYFSSDEVHPLCGTFNINGCSVYPLISGSLFIDANINGLYDLTESGYANAKVEIQPGNYIITTDSNGYYAVNVDLGTYTIQADASSYPYYTILPAIHNVTFNAFGQTSTANDFAMQPNAAINDLAVTLTPNGRARPGRGVVYTITYTNKGTTTLSGDVQLEYDAALIIDSTSLAVTTQSSKVLTWDYINLKPGQSKNIHVYCTAITTIQNGDILLLNSTINPITGDEVALDNVDSLNHIVFTSYDPNFKEVTPAADITPAQVASQENFTYTVHFQNTGSDTAFVVVIKDTISTNFEIQEIQTLASSHPCTMNMKNGAAAWMFYNILLPDSTTNEPASHGFVKYRIIPKNSLVLGDEIKNTAHIFFDYNAPVETNTTVNRVAINLAVQNASSSNNLLLYPNPTKGLLTLSIASKGTGTIRISNVEGKLIQQLESVDLSHELSLDLSAEAKGMYVIQVIASDGVMTKKVVVN